ncbi:unnamed protein product [Closterium sp. NIES-64]|nr:unnamed protein product [Closterium sp. NIES-64]
MLALHPILLAAELAEAGWSRVSSLVSKRTRRGDALKILEEATMRLEGSVARERAENARLQAMLEEYKMAATELLQQRAEDLAWMGDKVGTGEQQHEDLLAQIELKVNSPEFQLRLRGPPELKTGDATSNGTARMLVDAGRIEVTVPRVGRAQSGGTSASGSASTSGIASGSQSEGESECEGEGEEWWQWVTDMDAGVIRGSEPCEALEGEGAYEVVQVEEVVDGIAHVLARYIALHPEYQSLSPEELEKALSSGIQHIRRQGLLKQMYQWGRGAYKTACATSFLVSIYKERVLVRAIVGAVILSSRVVMRIACVILLLALLAAAVAANAKAIPVTCSSVRCTANSRCVKHTNGSLSCECNTGFFKSQDKCLSTCATVRCATNRVCEVDDDGSATCRCKPPYYVVGSECKDLCMTTKCPGGSACKVVSGKVKCVCPKGQVMTGNKCVKQTGSGGGGGGNSDPCASARCAAPSVCKAVNGTAVCSCSPPLVKRRNKCIDLCADVKCPTNAVCKPADFRGTCFCKEPYAMRKGKCVKP